MATDTGLAKKSPLETMKDIFETKKPQLTDLLPQGVTAKEVIQSAIQACRENPALLECTPASMLGAVAKCCQLGLPPADGTHRACIVPFNNSKKGVKEAQLIVEYRGLVYLAQNCEDLTPNNQVVCLNDFFEYSLGSKPFITHRLPKEGDRGAIVGAYAILEFPDKPPVVEYMTKAEIDGIRSRSRASSSGPWVTDYGMMARKTVLRRALRLAPMGTKRGEILQQAVQLDEKAELGMGQELELLGDAEAVGSVKTNQDRIAEAEKAQSATPAPTLGTPTPTAPVAQETATQEPKSSKILGTPELNDVKAAFADVSTIAGANKVLMGLPTSWQEDPQVQKIYQNTVAGLKVK